jgi:predicted HAD superfamily Cof-like phosphohydrolase
MQHQLEQVRAFHRQIGARIATTPQLLSHEPETARRLSGILRELGSKLAPVVGNQQHDELLQRTLMSLEELAEWIEAHNAGDLNAAADAWADRCYLLLGDAVSTGLPIGEIFEQVHRSNMTKSSARPDSGKARKSGDYQPPGISLDAAVPTFTPGDAGVSRRFSTRVRELHESRRNPCEFPQSLNWFSVPQKRAILLPDGEVVGDVSDQDRESAETGRSAAISLMVLQGIGDESTNLISVIQSGCFVVIPVPESRGLVIRGLECRYHSRIGESILSLLSECCQTLTSVRLEWLEEDGSTVVREIGQRFAAKDSLPSRIAMIEVILQMVDLLSGGAEVPAADTP